jgi:hypothetical protein
VRQSGYPTQQAVAESMGEANGYDALFAPGDWPAPEATEGEPAG